MSDRHTMANKFLSGNAFEIGLSFCYYRTIAALVDQIPMDTWDVLREIKERRPAMMLSELIDCRRRAVQQAGGSGTTIANNRDC
jgi:hypothetical protein